MIRLVAWENVGYGVAAAGVTTLALQVLAEPARRSSRALVTTLLGAMVALAPAGLEWLRNAFLFPPGGRPYVGPRETLGVIIVPALLVPPTLLAGYQLLGTLAGRGRPAPFRSVGRVVRDVLVGGALSMWLITDLFDSAAIPGPERASELGAAFATLAGGAVAHLAAWFTGRLGGESVRVAVLAGFVGGAIGPVLPRLLRLSRSVEELSIALCVLIGVAGPVLAGLVALRRSRIGAREAAIFGVDVFAPGDLALVPLAGSTLLVAAGGFALAGLRSRLGGAWMWGFCGGMVLAALLSSLAFAATLRALRRHLDRAEAHAAARAAEVERGATETA